MPGRNSLSCTTPCLMPAASAARASASAASRSSVSRLLAVHVLAGLDRRAHAFLAAACDLSVEVDVGALERLREVGRVLELVGLGERRELALVAADQCRHRPQRLARADRDPALLADRQDRAQQVLVGPHPPGHAVHRDPDRAAARRRSGVNVCHAPRLARGRSRGKPRRRLVDHLAALAEREAHERATGVGIVVEDGGGDRDHARAFRQLAAERDAVAVRRGVDEVRAGGADRRSPAASSPAVRWSRLARNASVRPA